MANASRGEEKISVTGLKNGNNPSMRVPGDGRVKEDMPARMEGRSAAAYTAPAVAKMGG